jgi:PERQ amino acid-rich with GYF domain-containing protein
MEKDMLELDTNKGHRNDFMGTMSKYVPGMSDLSEQVESTMPSMEMPAIAHSRHSSLSSAGNASYTCHPSLLCACI